MLLELLTAETIQFSASEPSWQEAIKLSAQPLLKNLSITEDYITAMIAAVDKFGPYIVIAPKVALPHARPEKGALKMGLSLLITKNEVKFSDDPEHTVNLLFALSATDSKSHILALTELSDVLGDEDAINALIAANNVAEVQAILQKYIQTN
jgi:mannitol/fructose-specific phosphotransferase system IIA component (Ntr-type)